MIISFMQKIKMSENQNRLREDGQFRFHEETAKLVATCTAAATAALLGTHQVCNFDF